jgi:hypothetical protein
MLNIVASSARLNERVPIWENKSGRKPAVTMGIAGDKLGRNLQKATAPLVS